MRKYLRIIIFLATTDSVLSGWKKDAALQMHRNIRQINELNRELLWQGEIFFEWSDVGGLNKK